MRTISSLVISAGILASAIAATGKDTSPSTGNGDIDLARRLEAAFEKVAEQVSPSVAVITTTRHVGGKDGAGEEDDGSGSPFERFFRRNQQQPRDDQSQGSGVILRADGYILTNGHVVDGADIIRVRFKDGTEFPAKLIGSDERTDVAVIKVDAKDLPAVKLADSDKIKVGQWAIAIGAPFELDYSFTVGFVSAKSRPPMDNLTVATIDYIQTDAAINPGNSGGPLCDIEGRVMGINTLIRGLNRGIGFAVPINIAVESADKLIQFGKVTRPWIGITIESLTENKDLAEQLKDVKEGVVVREIHPGTPAASSDLKPADVIVAVDGTPVKEPRDLQRLVLRKNVGDKVALDVIRAGKTLKVSLSTGELPDHPQFTASQKPAKPDVETGFGLSVQTLTKDLAKGFGLDDVEGVVVTAVADGSVAQQKGLQHGDLILEVDRQPVRSAEDFRKAMRDGNSTKGVLLYVKRAGTSTFVVLKEAK